MSLDLFEREAAERIGRLEPVRVPDTGAFDGFWRGAGMSAMQTFAKLGARAPSLAVGGALSIFEKMAESHPLGRVNTELSDRFFRAHDDLFQSAVDYWTPRPGEVGSAGQVVGQLAATIPMVIASPAATVAATQLGVSEDVSRKGVSTPKAVATGAAQGVGLATGIWMPIIGKPRP